ncbi:hypothetical protein [Rhodobium gokarnense]|uniref:Uncharacterized protein n=1 Tax=Rhodobium gokarnense TaxID=364296 RepID=A0ABT3HD92_9HYPH|nr:hypothetical protein [Rhodobium gokarnense]MCW2308251.1 hypothetical protein [Rhodobium gokarnense]
MAQLLLVGLIGIAAIVGWNTVKKEMARVEKKLHENDPKKKRARDDVETLEAGADGVYRPKE